MNTKILIVDDDPFLSENISRLLRTQGYECQVAHSADKALEALANDNFHLMILDLGLPDGDGFSLCRQARLKWVFPILMLTARSDAMDKVVGLEVGADDYLTKPFDPKELSARIRALLRRANEYQTAAKSESLTRVGDLEIDFDRRDALVSGRPAGLTHREFELLIFFMKHLNKALERDWVFEQVWGFDSEFSSNSLDVYIYRLRKKIEKEPNHPRYLITVRGYGYLFQTE